MNTNCKRLIPVTLVMVLCFGALKAQETRKRAEEKAQPVAQEASQENKSTAHHSLIDEVEEFAQSFERAANSWFEEFPFWPGKGSLVKENRVFDKHAVELPKVEFHTEKDGQSLIIEIKGLSAKKEDIKGHVGEGGQYALFKFNSDDSLIGIKIYRNRIDVFAQMDVTEEKKNPKGKVLSSFTYAASNAYSQSLPCKIDPAHLAAEYTNGTLRIKAESCGAKAIVIK